MSQAGIEWNSRNINLLKYPVSRLDYTYKTGSIAEKLVSDILKEEGIDVEPHNVHENGVDIRAKDVDIGIEVWNWCKPHEYSSRIQSVLENLKPFQFRALVTSFISDTMKNYIIDTYVMSPVLIFELGFQILPKDFKEFYKNRKDVVFYPSKQAYVKVRQKLKPLIKRIKDIGTDRILNKHFPVYEFEDIDLYDATGCSKEEFNNFTRELKEHREKVALISVPEPLVESPSNKPLSTKEPFNAYVYNTRKTTISRYKNDDSNTWTGKMGGKSTVSKSFRPKSFKSSSTFRDKFKLKVKELAKLVGETLKVRILNLLSEMSRLWNDTSGNVSLTKRSKTTWRPRSGFQVSLNEIQTRLIPHTYPCKHKIPVFCTEHKKTKYICKLTIDPYKDHSGYLKFYKGRLYCFCADYGDDLCWLHKYICFNNMLRREDCKWSRSKWEEKWMFEDNLKKKMRDEMIREKINKNKIGMVKHD